MGTLDKPLHFNLARGDLDASSGNYVVPTRYTLVLDRRLMLTMKLWFMGPINNELVVSYDIAPVSTLETARKVRMTLGREVNFEFPIQDS